MTAQTPTPTRAPARAVARPSVPRDTWNVLTRELRPTLRDPFSLIFSLLQPWSSSGCSGRS